MYSKRTIRRYFPKKLQFQNTFSVLYCVAKGLLKIEKNKKKIPYAKYLQGKA